MKGDRLDLAKSRLSSGLADLENDFIVIGPFVDAFLAECDPTEEDQLWRIFYDLALDPTIDGTRKFEADYFPYTGKGVRIFVDDTYLAYYSVDEPGVVHILTVYRVKELPKLG